MSMNIDDSFNFTTPVNDISSNSSNTSLYSIQVNHKPSLRKRPHSPLKNISNLGSIPSSPVQLKSRLRNVSNSPSRIQNKLNRAIEETPIYSNFDYNDTHSIIQEYENEEPLNIIYNYKSIDSMKKDNKNSFTIFSDEETKTNKTRKNGSKRGSRNNSPKIYQNPHATQETLVDQENYQPQNQKGKIVTIRPRLSIRLYKRKTKLPKPTEMVDSIDSILNVKVASNPTTPVSSPTERKSSVISRSKSKSSFIRNSRRSTSSKSSSKKNPLSILIPLMDIPSPPSFKLSISNFDDKYIPIIDSLGNVISGEGYDGLGGTAVGTDQDQDHEDERQDEGENYNEQGEGEGQGDEGRGSGDGDGDDDENKDNKRDTVISDFSTTQSVTQSTIENSIQKCDNVVLKTPSVKRIKKNTIENLKHESMVAANKNSSQDTISTQELMNNSLEDSQDPAVPNSSNETISKNLSNLSIDYTSNIEIFNKVYLKPNENNVKLSKIRPVSTTSSMYTNIPMTSPPINSPPTFENTTITEQSERSADSSMFKPVIQKPKLVLNTTFDKSFPYQNKRYSYNFRKNMPGRAGSTKNLYYLTKNDKIAKRVIQDDENDEVGLGISVDYDRADYFKSVPYGETVKGENPEFSPTDENFDKNITDESLVQFIEQDSKNNSRNTSTNNSKPNINELRFKDESKISLSVSKKSKSKSRKEFNEPEIMPLTKPATPITPYLNKYDIEKQDFENSSVPSSLDEQHYREFFDTDVYYNYASPLVFITLMIISLIIPPIYLLVGLGNFDNSIGKFSRKQKLFSLIFGIGYFVVIYICIGVGLGIGLRK